MESHQWMKMEQWIARAWMGFMVLLFVTLGAEMIVDSHPIFGPEKLPFFYAWFGFVACSIMVVLSKVLVIFLKRPEEYYEEEEK
jgi:hypothetical protein